MTRIREAESPLGNVITTAMINEAKDQGIEADFSLINHGSFRSSWFPGVVQYQHFYGMFPFSNRVMKF